MTPVAHESHPDRHYYHDAVHTSLRISADCAGAPSGPLSSGPRDSAALAGGSVNGPPVAFAEATCQAEGPIGPVQRPAPVLARASALATRSASVRPTPLRPSVRPDKASGRSCMTCSSVTKQLND